ncbi:MAG TPA: methionine--tRNA ligase [Acidobacteriaceae bacterium]|jgi:methionyl-tRNA synthetase|nr:methionine--tRNA ligase [Acidobacteriaceae bacterium]
MPTKKSKKPFYLTTPIYYVNARPHLGHTYTTVAADTIARYKRMRGFDVRFLTGTDEHGQKIERSAQKSGQSPEIFAGAVSAEFRSLWDRMGLTYDDYIRTTEERHKRGVQRLFTELKDRGFIYKGTYTGQYCVFDELYVDAPAGEPCPDCGRPTETVSEENYYFKLSAFERTLLEYYDAHPEFIRPETRRNEVIAFVRSGLKDLSISRTSFNWGIPVPGDEKHVIYVWMDALANYITALGYGSDAPADKACLAKFWPADLHLIGKEISRFHCVYWPAFLMAAGLPLPKSIVAHGWLLFEQSKMSKSRGNIVRAETILDVLGADALRYFLLREIAFGHDGSFSFDALVERYNADLANGYGNLASRTLTMIGKYFDGVVPVPAAKRSEAAERIAEVAAKVVAESNHRMEALEFSRALESIWTLVAAVDGYITATAPWKLGAMEDDASRAQLAEILYTCAEALRILTILNYPVVPQAATRIWSQIGLGDIAAVDREEIVWGELKPGTKIGELGPVFPRAEKDAIQRMQEKEEKNAAEAPPADAEPKAAPANPKAGTPQPITPSVQPVQQKTEQRVPTGAPAAAVAPAVTAAPAIAVQAPAVATAPAVPAQAVPAKIAIDDFTKVELRVAQIKVAERVPGADRLLRLEVDLGYEQRQIVAGIAEVYAPESLIGRKVVIVANLAPRKLRGLESNGMIVAASIGEKGKPVLAGFLEDVEIGARLK